MRGQELTHSSTDIVDGDSRHTPSISMRTEFLGAGRTGKLKVHGTEQSRVVGNRTCLFRACGTVETHSRHPECSGQVQRPGIVSDIQLRIVNEHRTGQEIPREVKMCSFRFLESPEQAQSKFTLLFRSFNAR